MTTSTSERRAFAPLVSIEDSRGQDYYVIDVLSARYEGMVDSGIGYDTFQVTDTEAFQPDAVAHKYYGDSKLWWLICSYNGIIDPYTQFVSGLKVKVPKLDEALLYMTREEFKNVSTPNRVGATGVI